MPMMGDTITYYFELNDVIFVDPPDTPFIDGYSEGDELQEGQEIQLVCRSAGGNPQAQLTWYRNKEKIPVFTNS